MISELRGGAHPVKMWTEVTGVESVALDQLRNIANLPYIHKHVAVMPDVHYGKGATVGSVIAMKDAVSPSAVGVDIGCGMAATKTSLTSADLPDDLSLIRSAIEAKIPVGFHSHSESLLGKHDPLLTGFDRLHPSVRKDEARALKQVGTLGSGNHFIELCLDTEDNVWLMLHSGSRNIGKVIAEAHIKIAKELPHNGDLPDRDLAVFLANTPEMASYRRDLHFAQQYAMANRSIMLTLYIQVMRTFFPQARFGFTVNAHHNYVSEEHHFGEDVLVTRKGAISARNGEYGIIPGSMGTKSYIVRGLGNPESFHSASHGAGRRMSRSRAKKLFTVDDLAAQTAGVECRKDQGVVDEIPGAYKDIEQVMANQADLVAIEAELRQVLCVKG
ncbi:RtcB family protein [Kribbella sp. NBC_01505]|uniref:RtcB family protein n=1 Tax=Kribbella sp. NBC_01505 TaxID=2903580 RepID=UPI0038630F49